MNDKQELKKRIDASYERRVKQWMESDPAQLLDAAETIAAAQLIHDNLDDAISEQDAKFLLCLDDPLGYLTDRWISENGADIPHEEELLHCVWTLQQEFTEKHISGFTAAISSIPAGWTRVTRLSFERKLAACSRVRAGICIPTETVHLIPSRKASRIYTCTR